VSEQDRLEHPDLTGWFESHDGMWLGITGLSEKEWRNAKRSLVQLGLLERKRMGLPSRMNLRLNIKLLADLTWQHALQSKDKDRLMSGHTEYPEPTQNTGGS
jgi:hypothetical protein